MLKSKEKKESKKEKKYKWLLSHKNNDVYHVYNGVCMCAHAWVNFLKKTGIHAVSEFASFIQCGSFSEKFDMSLYITLFY